MSFSTLLKDSSITSPSGHFICKNPTALNHTTNKEYVDNAIQGGVSGVTNPMTSNLDAGNYTITNISQTQTDSLYTHNIYKSSGNEINIHDPLHMTNNKITHMGEPSSNSDATTKGYVDGEITTVSSSILTNTSNISTNTSNIATNTSNIATNTTNIATNTSDIATNTTNIATNTSDIAAYNIYDMIIAVTDETTPISVGTNQVKVRTPRAFTLTAIKASLSTAQTSGTLLTVDVKQGPNSIFSTFLTFNNGSFTTVGATTPYVLTSTPLSIGSDAEISVDVTQIGNGTAKGLKIDMLGKL